MPQLMIPHLRTEIVLAQPWTFTLHAEYRNDGFRKALNLVPPRPYQDAPIEELDAWFDLNRKSHQVTLPKDTILSIDRIFIRNGMPQYDSVTFRLRSHPTDAKVKGRFWAKLDEVNTIVYK